MKKAPKPGSQEAWDQQMLELARTLRKWRAASTAPPETLLKDTVKAEKSGDTAAGFFSDFLISGGSIREVRKEMCAVTRVFLIAIDDAMIYSNGYSFLMIRMEYLSPYSGRLCCWLAKKGLEDIQAEELTAAGQKPEHWLFAAPLMKELRERCHFDSIRVNLTEEERAVYQSTFWDGLIPKNRDVFSFIPGEITGSFTIRDYAYVHHIAWKYIKPAPADFCLCAADTVFEGNPLVLTVTLWGEVEPRSNPLFNRQFDFDDLFCRKQWTCECTRCGSKNQKEIKSFDELRNFLQAVDSGCKCPSGHDRFQALLAGEKRFYIGG